MSKLTRCQRAGLLLLALSFPVCGSAVAVDYYHRHPQTHPKPYEVVLWRAKLPETSLALLTPGCDVHDWGCVIGASAKRGGGHGK